MARSLIFEIVKSVSKTTLTSTMIAISVVRIAMIVYPSQQPLLHPFAPGDTPSLGVDTATKESTSVSLDGKRRIVLGQHSIDQLNKAK